MWSVAIVKAEVVEDGWVRATCRKEGSLKL